MSSWQAFLIAAPLWLIVGALWNEDPSSRIISAVIGLGCLIAAIVTGAIQ